MYSVDLEKFKEKCDNPDYDLKKDFALRNNLYLYIFNQPIGDPSARMPFASADVFVNWLRWVRDNNTQFNDEEFQLINNLIEAAKLDFKAPEKMSKNKLNCD